MELVASGQTHVGQREHNEDAFLIDDALGLYVVADGLGGAGAGEVASRIALDCVHRHVKAASQQSGAQPSSAEQSVMSAISNGLNQASESIYRQMKTGGRASGMATTATVICFTSGRAIVGHVGDSRLYLIRGPEIFQITEDHTMLQEFLRLNQDISEADKISVYHNTLSRSVGSQPRVNVDLLNLDVCEGDRLVLCSDGLSDVVDADEVRAIAAGLAPDNAAGRLIAQANRNASPDNITVIAIEVRGVPAGVQALPMEQKVSVLQRVFLFEELTLQELVRVLAVVREARFAPDRDIIREGEPGGELYVLVSGEVAVTRRGRSLIRIKAGGHFGELGLVTGGVRSATVRTVTDAVVLSISKDDFFQLVSRDHSLAVKLLWRFLIAVSCRVKDLSDAE